MFVRAGKGIAMFFMFFLFAFGIFVELIFILPVIRVIEKFKGYKPSRMQNVHRFFFVIWLGLMRAGRMLKGKPSKGKCFDGPCIIIANHPGLFDVLFMIRDIPKLTVLVKRSLVQFLPLGPIFKSSGYILSPGKGDSNPVESLLNAIEKLNLGYKFLLFPEGTRSPAGGLRQFKAGAFKIAQKQGIPLQPVIIHNTPPFLPKGEPWYFPAREISEIEIEFLDPFDIPAEKSVREVVQEVEELYRNKLINKCC